MSIIPGLKAGVSVSEAIRLMAQAFRQAGLEDAEIDARALLGHALHLDRAQLISHSDRIARGARNRGGVARWPRAGSSASRWRASSRARNSGTQTLQVTPAVLVPRPETETVVEAALEAVARGGLRMEKLRILDIGTGSGALLLALLGELPNAVGIGTDISAPALDVARGNAERNGLAERSNFVDCNIAEGVQGPFDLIVSNPPYVPRGDIAALAPEVRDYDPALALDGGADGLDGYRAIAADARRLLAPGGRLIVELGAGQEPAVRALFTKAGLTVAAVHNDLAGIPRALGATVAP